MKKTQILIIGGGTGGITVAARLKKTGHFDKITVLEPSLNHFYQPLWTLVGAGVVKKEITKRAELRTIPKGVDWLRDEAISFLPEKNIVMTKTMGEISYDYLVISTGYICKWDKIKGLKETIGKNNVVSNYSYETVDSTFKALQEIKSGNILFTQPSCKIKCGGAPQKAMWLSEDYFRKKGIRKDVNIEFYHAGPRIFGVEKYRIVLEEMVIKRDVHMHFHQELVEVKGENKIAIFQNLETKELTEVPFQFLHVTPFQGPPEVIMNSPLADENGEVDVDKFTLQHKKYPNVFALGDSTNLPCAKTGASVRKQAPVLVMNMVSNHIGETLEASYNGYASCPLVTSYGKVMLAEFDYDGNPTETFPFNQAKERRSMYFLKRFLLPILYWYGMLKGRA